MYKKKLILSKVLTVSMAASLLSPSAVYATEIEIGMEEELQTGVSGPEDKDLPSPGNVSGDGKDDGQSGTGSGENIDLPVEEQPAEPVQPEEPEQPQEPEEPEVSVDLSTIVKDYQGNYWIPVEGGYARCTERGEILEGYAIVTEVPKAPEQTADPQEPAPDVVPAPEEGIEVPVEAPVVSEAPQEPEVVPEEEQAAVQEEQTQPAEGNAGLIASQQIVIPPRIEEINRFVKVAKKYAVADVDSLQIYEEMDESSRAVGSMGKDGLCYVLKEVEPENEGEEIQWIYVESGVVRGFVKADQLITGDEAQGIVDTVQEINMHLAQALVDPFENKALTYTKTTVRETVVEKVYAIAKDTGAEVREETNEESRAVGMLENGALCYVLADAKDGWLFVESEDVRGFVQASSLIQGEDAKARVEEAGEENMAVAQELVDPKENGAFYYTITSVKEGMVSSAIRNSMLTFAQQFVGNPYVWGGTSLTNGADCSGFVQSIYAAYGYSLPRTSREQATYGMQIPVEEAQPGDLIFYAKNGTVYHVVMYIGDGQTVEAQSSKTGIVNSTINYDNAVWATRVISDEDVENIDTVNSAAEEKPLAYTLATTDQIGDYLGNFKLTAYCHCSLCNGQWAGAPTASGTMPVEGRTVAMAGLPFGTKLVINGQIFTVEDRGTPYGHVDIFMNDHEQGNEFGVQYANVFLFNEDE